MKKKRFGITYLHNYELVTEVIEDVTIHSVINRLYNELGNIWIMDTGEVEE